MKTLTQNQGLTKQQIEEMERHEMTPEKYEELKKRTVLFKRYGSFGLIEIVQYLINSEKFRKAHPKILD